MKPSFSQSQKKLLLTCLAAYTAAYFCRLNLSAALSGVMEAFSLSMAKGGMLQTVFAACYASGQLINGALVDRVNPVRHLLTGIVGTAVCNLIMGFSLSYPMLLIVWAVNALFQSMMWTPIVRLIAIYVTDQRLRVIAQGVLAMTLILGHFGAWAISGFLSGFVNWHYSFIVPACIALLVFFISSRILSPFSVQAEKKDSASSANSTAMQMSAWRLFRATGFYFVLACCMLYGFVRDGVVTWTPTMLARISGAGDVSATAFTLILPAINFFGVCLGFWLRLRGVRPYTVVLTMMLFVSVCSAILTGISGMLLTAVLLGLICAATYGANTMLTAIIPMDYDRAGRTGLTAGMIDSMIYLGSAFSGVLGGFLYERSGVDTLFTSFIVASVSSAIMIFIGGRMYRGYFSRLS